MVGLALISALQPGVATARGGHGQAARPGAEVRPEAEVVPPSPRDPGPGACDAAQLRESLCPLRSLFVDPDVIGVSASNVMKVGEGFLNAADEGLVRDMMAQVFEEVSSILQSRAAPVALALDSIDL